MMTIHMKTASEMERELQQSFKVFDVNGDGFINASELRQAMTTIGEKMTEKDVSDIMKQWDSDSDGKIDYKGRLVIKLQITQRSLQNKVVVNIFQKYCEEFRGMAASREGLFHPQIKINPFDHPLRGTCV